MDDEFSATSSFDPYAALQKGGQLDDEFSATSSFNPYTAPRQKGGRLDDEFSATSSFNPFNAQTGGGDMSATSPNYYMGSGNAKSNIKSNMVGSGKTKEVTTEDIYRLLKESEDNKQVGGNDDNIFLDTSNDDNEDDSDLNIEKYMKKQDGGEIDEDDYNTSDININSYHSSQ